MLRLFTVIFLTVLVDLSRSEQNTVTLIAFEKANLPFCHQDGCTVGYKYKLLSLNGEYFCPELFQSSRCHLVSLWTVYSMFHLSGNCFSRQSAL